MMRKLCSARPSPKVFFALLALAVCCVNAPVAYASSNNIIISQIFGADRMPDRR